MPILRSYGDVSRVEDVVLNAVEILTARETQVFNMLSKTSARDTIHSYLVDTLKTAENTAIAEAADYTHLTRTTPTRLTNIVQNIAIPFSVTRTQELVEHYHGRNELQRQLEKGIMEWANDAEFALTRSTLTSGASGTAPQMSGLIQATSKSSNHTNHTSGTIWSASILDGLMKDNIDNSNGDVATDIIMGSHMRKKTDEFVQKSNVVVNAPGITQIIRTVTTYETFAGTLRVHYHRYIQQTADTTSRVFAFRPEKAAVAFLERPRVDTTLSRAGDYTRRAVVGKFTAEIRNQDSFFYAGGFHLTS